MTTRLPYGTAHNTLGSRFHTRLVEGDENFTRTIPTNIFTLNSGDADNVMSVSATLCTTLGVLSFILNVYVALALLVNRKQALRNVFYIIVLHCAVVDCAR